MKFILVGLLFIFVACASHKATTQVSHAKDKKDKKEAKRVPTSHGFSPAVERR